MAVSQCGKEDFELVFGPAGSARDALRIIDGIRGGDDRRRQHPLWNGVACLLNGKALENVAPAQKEASGGRGGEDFSRGRGGGVRQLGVLPSDRARFGGRAAVGELGVGGTAAR